MKDLGELHHFLGVTVKRRSGGLFLSQRQYILDVLERAGIAECKPCSTPVDTQAKLPLLQVIPSVMLLSTEVLSELCSTSTLLSLISPMRSNKCAFTCTLRETLT